jgi:signal transduction histidine kinase
MSVAETILVSGAMALILCIICMVAWSAAAKRILAEEEKNRAERERAKLVPDAIVGRDYRRILHDIRGPLSTIRIAAGVLRLKDDDELDEISIEVENCAKIIDNLVESINSMELAQGIAIVDSIRDCAFIYGNGADIVIDIDNDMALVCVPMLFDRLVGNIISNATKHRTAHSRVVIRGCNSGRGFVVINETSNPVNVSNLWSTDRRQNGLGMGIIRNVAAELGVVAAAKCTKAHKGWTFQMEVTW